jgi:carbamoyl-phosphate synthase small subunit
LIVRDASLRESNWRAHQTLTHYLQEHNIMALTDIDTRALTRHLRKFGALRGTVSTVDLDPDSLCQKALDAPTTSDRDLVAEVTCTEPYEWTETLGPEWQAFVNDLQPQRWFHVVAYDCGIKRNILRQLSGAGCQVTVVPAQTSAATVLAMRPDGVFLSNGPGDPENVPYTVAAVKALLGKVPIFGICLGHQVLGLAYGGEKYKLKFGHHGSNHPVKDLQSGKIAITAQNHNFAIDALSLPGDVEVTHLNLYDGTLEGMRHTSWPAFSVQYHPEAAPGPHDANPLFGEFITLMREARIAG